MFNAVGFQQIHRALHPFEQRRRKDPGRVARAAGKAAPRWEPRIAWAGLVRRIKLQCYFLHASDARQQRQRHLQIALAQAVGFQPQRRSRPAADLVTKLKQ